VIDTLAVVDAQPPNVQPEGPPQGGTEGPPQNRDTDQKDNRHFWFRVAAAGVLLLLAIGFVLWLFVDPPNSFAARVSIVVAAALICGVGVVCLPLGLRNRLGTFGIVAATSAGILAAVLAIPGTSPVSGSRESSPSPSPPDSDPFTWDLTFPYEPFCETFAFSYSRLKSLSVPDGDKLNAEWAYRHGGSTANPVATLIIQVNSNDPVVCCRSQDEANFV
jgi:hypothetical protein